MTAFQPLSASAAIGLVEAAGIQDARQMIADFAAAGLLKTYALAIETVEEGGRRSAIRGSAIPAELWHRIVDEGRLDDAWRGGMVRLMTGQPQVAITGISFSEKHVERLIEQHRPAMATASPALVAEATVRDQAPLQPLAEKTRREPVPESIPATAELVTVDQAMAALALGRTKVNELMNAGQLQRIKLGRRTLITVTSLRSIIETARRIG